MKQKALEGKAWQIYSPAGPAKEQKVKGEREREKQNLSQEAAKYWYNYYVSCLHI